MNAIPDIKHVLIIAPASLKINWQRELLKWLVRPLTIGFANGSVPDTDIVIINYEILKKHSAALRDINWDMIIADECHRLKNPKSQRSQQVYGNKKEKLTALKAKRRIFLTGTPILNRPVELWPIAHYLDPSTFVDFFPYAKRYCNAHQNRFGWDFSGAANLNELQEKLRSSIMVRRLKKDVLTELPAKQRQVIVIPADGCARLIKAESEAWEDHQENIAALRANVELALAESDEAYKTAVEALTQAHKAAFNQMAKIRHDIAVAKAPYVAEAITEMIEDNPEKKIVVFAHHHDVIDILLAEFGAKAVHLTGKDKLEDRQVAIDSFQNDPAIQVFVGSITAAGVGITLTAAAHAVFAELTFVPAEISQAESRLHRIGQHNSVLIQHIVLDGSLDVKLAQTIVKKQTMIEKALDGMSSIELAMPVVPIPEMITVTKKEYDVPALTDEQKRAILTGLQMLAGMCDGAQSIDGMGFNKMDARIGRSLAMQASLSPRQAVLGRKMVLKYHRQLPLELTEAARGEK